MQQIFTLVMFELERAFTRRQAALYLSAFTFLWYLMIRFAVLNLPALTAPNANPAEWADAAMLGYFNIGLYVFCLLSMLACANQTCADRGRGTLRFLTLRCSRLTVFTARFIAQCSIFSILILLVTTAVFMVLCIHVGFSASLLLNAALYALVLIISVLPFIALMAVLSVSINVSRKVSVAAVFIWAMAASIITGLSHYVPVLSVLEYLVPGSQFDTLLQYEGTGLLLQSTVPLLQTAVLFSLGALLMKRQAL